MRTVTRCIHISGRNSGDFRPPLWVGRERRWGVFKPRGRMTEALMTGRWGAKNSRIFSHQRADLTGEQGGSGFRTKIDGEFFCFGRDLLYQRNAGSELLCWGEGREREPQSARSLPSSWLLGRLRGLGAVRAVGEDHGSHGSHGWAWSEEQLTAAKNAKRRKEGKGRAIGDWSKACRCVEKRPWLARMSMVSPDFVTRFQPPNPRIPGKITQYDFGIRYLIQLLGLQLVPSSY